MDPSGFSGRGCGEVIVRTSPGFSGVGPELSSGTKASFGAPVQHVQFLPIAGERHDLNSDEIGSEFIKVEARAVQGEIEGLFGDG